MSKLSSCIIVSEKIVSTQKRRENFNLIVLIQKHYCIRKHSIIHVYVTNQPCLGAPKADESKE